MEHRSLGEPQNRSEDEKRRQCSGSNDRALLSAKHYAVRLMKKGIKGETENGTEEALGRKRETRKIRRNEKLNGEVKKEIQIER